MAFSVQAECFLWPFILGHSREFSMKVHKIITVTDLHILR